MAGAIVVTLASADERPQWEAAFGMTLETILDRHAAMQPFLLDVAEEVRQLGQQRLTIDSRYAMIWLRNGLRRVKNLALSASQKFKLFKPFKPLFFAPLRAVTPGVSSGSIDTAKMPFRAHWQAAASRVPRMVLQIRRAATACLGTACRAAVFGPRRVLATMDRSRRKPRNGARNVP